jgi:hypothetical protein
MRASRGQHHWGHRDRPAARIERRGHALDRRGAPGLGEGKAKELR